MAVPLQTTISVCRFVMQLQVLSTRLPEAETGTHLDSASAMHRAAAASLLHQSKLYVCM